MAKKIIRKKKTGIKYSATEKQSTKKLDASIEADKLKEEKPKSAEALEEASKVEVSKSTIEIARELMNLKEKRKLIEDREKELKSRLSETLTSQGYKDTKGSYIVKTKIDGCEKILKKEARKTIKLNPTKAEELFREKGIWDFVTEQKEVVVINEDYVEQAILDGKLTTDELEGVTDIKVSYAVLVKDYKPDEEEGVI